MKAPRRRDFLRYSTLLVGASPLLGCGGSSGGDASGVDPVTPPVVTPPVVTPPVVQPPTQQPPAETPPVQQPPVTTPAGSTGARQFSLLSAVTQTAPFCVGFVIRQGDVPSGSGIAVTGATAQATVKNRWADGSARFAIVAGTASLTAGQVATVAVSAGADVSGAALGIADLQRAMTHPVVVDAGSLGSASWASAGDWSSPFQTWVTGPLMSSWVFRKPVGSDEHLVAWLEVRLFLGGAVEVLPWIENGYLNVASPGARSATYTFTMGGSQRFGMPIDLQARQRTPLLNGTATAYWQDAAFDVVVKHDAQYMSATGLVPAYFGRVDPAAAVVAALPTSFSPLQAGNWDTSGLSSGGFHDHIGLLAQWDALYLTSAAAATYKGMVFQGYSAGRYPLYYRDETTHRPLRFSQYPLLNIHTPGYGWFPTPEPASTTAPHWSLDHQPAIGYLPYLVTGRWYFMDEIQHSASTNYLLTPYTWREQSKGLLKSQTLTTRGHAWAFRTLALALSATPDDDTALKAEYAASMSENINWLHARYVARPNNPQGFITPYGDSYNGNIGSTAGAGSTATAIVSTGGIYGPPYNLTADDHYVGWTLSMGSESRTVTAYVMATDTLTVSPPFSAAPAAGTPFVLNDSRLFEATWQQDFVTGAWGYAKDLRLGLDSATLAKLDALFEWKARSVVGRLGSAASDQFLYRDAAPYTISVAPSDAPDFDGGTGPWYANWGEVYAATYGGRTPLSGGAKPPPYASPGTRVDGPLRGDLSGEAYWANAMPAIAYAVKHQAAGAQAAYQRLTSSSNWAAFVASFDIEPVWGVSPTVVPS